MLKHWFPLCLAVFALAGCSRAEPSRAEFALGTVCNITLFDHAEAQTYRNIFGRIREIENRMSVNLLNFVQPQTDVMRINAAAGHAPVQVSSDVFAVIERAVYFAGLTGGAFDSTIGPLVSLWGIGSDNPRVPSQEEIDAVLPLIDWRNIELNREDSSVFLKLPGMALDLGAIAKGCAVDEAAAIVKKARVKRAIIDLGGDIVTSGEKKDKTPWKIGIQEPFNTRGAYIGIANVREQAVVTSGVYERYFEEDGVRYHHIFSPSTGFPATNNLLSVTVIAYSAMDADALSTGLFVLGYEKGRTLIESLDGFEAVFIFEDKSVRKTAGADFILTNGEYRLVE